MKSRIIALTMICLVISCYLRGQVSKPVLDSNAIRNWVILKGDPVISNNGDYLAYGQSVPRGRSVTMVVRSTKGEWKREVAGVKEYNGIFLGDCKEFVFMRSDTLYFLVLGTEGSHYVAGVSSWKQAGAGNEEWIAWQLKDSTRELVLHNVVSGVERRFSSVEDYRVDEGGKSVMLHKITKSEMGSVESLEWVSLPEGQPVSIWKGERGSTAGGFLMDRSGSQAVFWVRPLDGDEHSDGLWYYKAGTDKAVAKVNDRTEGIEVGLSPEMGSAQFSGDGRYIFFGLRGPDLRKASGAGTQVDVWSYKDTLLQSVQLHRLDPASYRAVIGTGEGEKRVIRLQREHEEVGAVPTRGDYVVMKYDESSDDRFWMKISERYWLMSLKDGSRKVLKADKRSDLWFSPGGTYLVYYRESDYYSYELSRGVERKISVGVPAGRLSGFSDRIGKRDPDMGSPLGIGGWLKKDSGLLVYDGYDIWRMDLSGKKAAVNMTNCYGRRHHLMFRLVDEEVGTDRYVGEEGGLLLTAFNEMNKYNGFYRSDTRGDRDPEELTMGPWMMNHESKVSFFAFNTQDYEGSLRPLKAQDANIWIAERSTATDAPNYYITEDLKRYRRLTDLQPQKKYNWLTTELMTYPQLDGTKSEGVLYKPEDFDPHKKYPVIIQYYEQFSDRLYEFPTPDFTDGQINIAWFVSRGYLVFTPDIHYKPGHPGESARNSVVAAGLYLSKIGYVDRKKMGINGHSWGGYETYYLVTHTHLFAAVLASSGGSGSADWISASLALAKHHEEQSFLWGREGMMGATLWKRPDRYIENSPVFKADQVRTPLLMLQCKADETWGQGVEMFLALRRLGKKTWMLQYDHGNHLVGGRDGVDYTIRATQFFDHYLKDTPAPKWMTEGIPARLKGIETGYELDTSGKQP